MQLPCIRQQKQVKRIIIIDLDAEISLLPSSPVLIRGPQEASGQLLQSVLVLHIWHLREEATVSFFEEKLY